MPFELHPCEDADMPKLMTLMIDNFDFAYFRQLFPNPTSEKGQKDGAARLLEEKHEKHSRFIKAVDTSTGTIAGWINWLVFENEPDPPDEFFTLEGDYWEDEEKKQQSKYVVGEFSQFRKNAIRNARGDLLVLDILVIDKKYQRQGIGRTLVKWGTDLADELGYGAVVESSFEAIRLYESAGFRLRYYVAIRWPRKWAHLETCELNWMTRPARVG